MLAKNLTLDLIKLVIIINVQRIKGEGTMVHQTRSQICKIQKVYSQVCRLKPIIPATQVVEVGGSQSEASPQKKHKTLSEKKVRVKGIGSSGRTYAA
jgi:hypothetical protein